MPLFGTITIWTALVALLASLALYFTANALRADAGLADRLTRWGRRAFLLAAASVLAAAGTLGALLVTHRFDVNYVYQHSARAMAPLYWFPSFWAGQEGSFLLWAFWTSILGVVLAATSGRAERRVMPLYSLVLLFLVGMLALRSPFLPTLDEFGLPSAPPEGLGLNPNLENPWMVIHPPTLFLGFSSLAVPFAFALSALFWRDWDGWLRRALPWGLFGFAVLGLAMMMGGYWAYEMLGWGGFWEGDPVENGPFIPWIGRVAFLHAAQIQRVRGGFSRPTLFLATLPFIGAMYESFMTRSGVLSDFSVHSFSELGGIANTLLLYALALVTLASVAALAWRSRELAKREAGTESVLEAPATREYGYTLAIALLTLCAVIAAVGMSAPLLSKLGVQMHIAKYSASVSEDYHNKAMFPLAVLIALGMGIGPHLAWRGRGGPDSRRLILAYAVSVVGAVVFIVLARYLGTGLTGAKLVPQLVLFTASLFAVVANLMLLAGRLRPSGAPIVGGGGGLSERGGRFRTATCPWTVGGTFPHLGAATLLIGVICLVVFVRKDPDVGLFRNLPQSVLDDRYVMTYKGQSSDYRTDKDNALLFDVASRDGREKFTARLPFALRPVEGGEKKLFGHPAIVHHAGGDLYFALKDGPENFYPRGRYVETLKLGATQKYGPFTLHFDKFERDPQAAALAMSGQMPAVFPVWAVMDVTYQGKTVTLKPQSIMRRDTPGDPETPEIAMPGGWLLSFQSMNAGSADANNPNAGATAEAGTFVLRPAGPVVEGFKLEVTTRPMISLVWIGTLLIFAGGLVSMRRRILENRALPVPDLPDAAPKSPKIVAPRRRAKGRVSSAKPATSLMASGRK